MRIAMALDQLEDVVRAFDRHRSSARDQAGDLRGRSRAAQDAGGSGDVTREIENAVRILERQADELDRMRRDLRSRIERARSLLEAPSLSFSAVITGIASALRDMFGGGSGSRGDVLGARTGPTTPYPVKPIIGTRAGWERLDAEVRRAFIASARKSLDPKSLSLEGARLGVDVLVDLGQSKAWRPALGGSWKPAAHSLLALGLITDALEEFDTLSARRTLSPLQVTGGTALKVGFVSVWAAAGGLAFGTACAASLVGTLATPVCALAGAGIGMGIGIFMDALWENVFKEQVLGGIGVVDEGIDQAANRIREEVMVWSGGPYPQPSAAAPADELPQPMDLQLEPDPLVPTDANLPPDPGHGGPR